MRRLSKNLSLGWCLALLAPAAASGSFPGGNGVIAYGIASTDDCHRQPGVTCATGIWAVDPLTGNQLRLTTGHDSNPSFSPSGNLIAFQRRTRHGFTIYV